MPDKINILSTRIITVGPGLTAIEFPKGYAFPIMSDQKLKVFAQVLNLNEPEIDKQIVHKSYLNYSLDKNEHEAIKPLFTAFAYITRPIKGKEYDSEVYKDCRPAVSADKTGLDEQSMVTSHWVVKPGEETSRINVTAQMNVPYNTTVHYIGSHMHPYASHIALYDVTDSVLVFRAKASNYENKSGITKMEHYSSTEGFMLYRDHQYELECKTYNPTSENQDMMAVLYMYLYDKELDEKIKIKKAEKEKSSS